MNHDDQAPAELSPEERLHQDLCSLAFGELDGEAAAALEARLAAEPLLRAQYDEVRATIGLVRSNLGSGAALPAHHMQAVLAGAHAARSTPIHQLSWYRRPAVKLAAAVVLIAGAGLIGLRILERDGADAGGDARIVDSSLAAGAAPAPSSEPADAAEMAGVNERLQREAVELEREVDRIRKDASIKVDMPEVGVRALGVPADGQAVDARTQSIPAVEPVTLSLEDLSALGLDRGGEALRGSNAAGQPSAGFFFDETSGQAPGGAPTGAPASASGERLDALNAGEASVAGDAALPRTKTSARGELLQRGRAASDGPAGPASPALSTPGATHYKLDPQISPRHEEPVGRAKTELERQRSLGYGGGVVGATGATGATSAVGAGGGAGGGGSYRGPGDTAPPDPTATRMRRSGSVAPTEPKRGGTREQQVGGGSDDFFLGYLGRDVDRLGQTVDRPEAEKEAPPAAGAGGEVAADVELRYEVADGYGAEVVDELDASLRGYYERSGNPRLTAEQLASLADQQWRVVMDDCVRRPQERPRDMYFRFWGDNAFVEARKDALSTFAADVDTASYALARRMLREGRMPVKAQVRTEEFVNAFQPDLPAPAEGTFGLHVELAPSPFSSDARGADAGRHLVRVGVRGKEVAAAERQPLNLTFVVDTSGSMREGGRLELVKHAMRLLVSQLEARDTIAIVAYSNEARQILLPTSAAERNLIESAIHPLAPNGSTNAEAGLKMGYALAETMLTVETHNRIVFLSDGVANVGETDQDRIAEDVKRLRDAGIHLNTIGVGMNNHNDVFLEQLADKGDGICDYVDDAKGAEEAIVERFTGAFVSIASDVKLQVEFDPTQVLRWRQLGYENRAVADKDFRNDKIDAGEVGAGHQVTCLYEVELADDVAADAALATLRVRWKAPKAAGQDPNEIDVFEEETSLVRGSGVASFDAASPGFRRSACAAQFAEFLRRSSHARDDSYGDLVAHIGKLLDESAAQPESAEQLVELADLVRRADGLGLGRRTPVSDLQRSIDAYKRYQYLKATLDDLEHRRDDDVLRQLEDTNRTLENQIRDLIRRDLQEKHG